MMTIPTFCRRQEHNSEIAWTPKELNDLLTLLTNKSLRKLAPKKTPTSKTILNLTRLSTGSFVERDVESMVGSLFKSYDEVDPSAIVT